MWENSGRACVNYFRYTYACRFLVIEKWGPQKAKYVPNGLRILVNYIREIEEFLKIFLLPKSE